MFLVLLMTCVIEQPRVVKVTYTSHRTATTLTPSITREISDRATIDKIVALLPKVWEGKSKTPVALMAEAKLVFQTSDGKFKEVVITPSEGLFYDGVSDKKLPKDFLKDFKELVK